MKAYKIEAIVHICQMAELSEEDRELVEAAKQATNGSYAPYSKFLVGAAARLKDGTVVKGANQENAAFPSGLCAERTALFAAGAQHPQQPVVALAIAARKGRQFLPQPISPCGACRQVISGVEERYGIPIRIMLYGTEGVLVSEGISPLLPLRFADEDMRNIGH
ncbi:MAG: cytidine deaminase [Bacteroidaceae bacterium]|nr:cytidine deaminase [Bacteroidaceae bacterium]